MVISSFGSDHLHSVKAITLMQESFIGMPSPLRQAHREEFSKHVFRKSHYESHRETHCVSSRKSPRKRPRGNRAGYLLLGLMVFFSVLALTSSVAVFEQDTRLKRFGDEEVKMRLDSLRRAIDLYRQKYIISDPARIAVLNTKLQTNATDVIYLLASESFLSARMILDPVSSGSGGAGSTPWRIVQNLVSNGSFEKDDGTNYGLAGDWQGNFSAEDDVPDGWELTAQGAQQKINLTGPATYVASFWARAGTLTSGASLSVWPSVGAIPLITLSGGSSQWKRQYGYFFLPANDRIRFEIIQTNTTSGDEVFVDGLMLERWQAPTGAPTVSPVPSAWVESSGVVSSVASETIGKRFIQDLLGPTADPASVGWWLEY
ncbi:MAG: hypothetical protein WA705_07110 [Candidatus Ozemobacteraceae bacterium]